MSAASFAESTAFGFRLASIITARATPLSRPSILFTAFWTSAAVPEEKIEFAFNLVHSVLDVGGGAWGKNWIRVQSY
jgi:hypothetical protein